MSGAMTTNDETSPVEETLETAPVAPKVEDPEEVRAAAKEALGALRENPAAATNHNVLQSRRVGDVDDR